MTDEVKNTEENTAPVEETATEAPAEETKEDAPAADATSAVADESTDSDEGADPSRVDGDEADVEVPAKFKDLVEQVENMSVLELNELVKLLEKKFGVSAAAVAVAGPAAGAAEEKDEFDVELISDGGAKIPVMKAIKEILGLGLKEAKEMVESLPTKIKEGVKKDEAEEVAAKIKEAGGEVKLS